MAVTAGLWTREPDEPAVDAWRWRPANPEGEQVVGPTEEREAAVLAELAGA